MYDLIVIGAGWAGCSAASYASKRGHKVALIERDRIGGTCLNYGCIPTKTILQTTKLLSQFRKSSKFAISADSCAVDLARLDQRLREVNSQLKAGLDFMVKSAKVEFIKASARIINPNQVSLGDKILDAKYILIATGSRPIELPGIRFDFERIISSAEALNIAKVPGKILIIGGGVIGCEFAQIYFSLGAEVGIVELTSCLLPGIDKEAAKKIEMIFKKRGIKVFTDTDACAMDLAGYDKVLLCVGRRPHSDCAEGIDLNKDKGRILVNEYLQTSQPNIYAAGDCIGGYLLAHTASYEGRLAAENILGGNKVKANYKSVPSCVFTNPEIACAGLSEEEARRNYPEIIIKKFDFRAVGMSHVLDETEGFVKIICDNTEKIIGAVIIGPRAAELIHILNLAVSNDLTLNHLRDTIFAHPTLSESILEAALH